MTTFKPERLDKKEALAHWQQLPADMPLKMRRIPYKTAGSKYGFDGVRIDGTREFIDSVLSHLKPLIAGENGSTRLELNYTEVVDRDSGRPTGNWVCYIRTHERGDQAKMLAALFGEKAVMV